MNILLNGQRCSYCKTNLLWNSTYFYCALLQQVLHNNDLSYLIMQNSSGTRKQLSWGDQEEYIFLVIWNVFRWFYTQVPCKNNIIFCLWIFLLIRSVETSYSFPGKQQSLYELFVNAVKLTSSTAFTPQSWK